MSTLTIEIPEKVEKTFCDLVELLGGKVIKIESDQKLTKEINKKQILNSLEKSMSLDRRNKSVTDEINGELEAIIFMKFGYHAEEKEDDIVVRKRLEFKKTGKIFWGYGGSVCHPEKQVREFVKEMHLQGKKVFLAMSFTKSKSKTKSKLSLQFSHDNLNWDDVPHGVEDLNLRLSVTTYLTVT